MTAGHPDDAMLEIGDIDEPGLAPEPPPVVVIEYRDRGVPWMLIPPLLVAAVVVAAVVVLTLNKRYQERRPLPTPALVAVADPSTEPTPPATSIPGPGLTPGMVPDPVVVENPPPLPNPIVPDAAAASPVTAGSGSPETPIVAADPPTTTEPVAPPGLRADAIGFDPGAFAVPLAPAAPLDRNVAVAQAGRGEDPAAAAPAPDQPEQIDPDLLPPDPRQAQFDRKQREIRSRRKLEEDRSRFHADLAALTKKLGRRAAPAIEQLCQDYGQDIPPAAMEKAKKSLGPNGLHAGANTSERIGLLRAAGFPESAILGDIVDIEGRHEDKTSRSYSGKGDLLVRSAMVLLNHPPNRPATNARAAAAARSNFRTTPTTNPTDPDR